MPHSTNEQGYKVTKKGTNRMLTRVLPPDDAFLTMGIRGSERFKRTLAAYCKAGTVNGAQRHLEEATGEKHDVASVSRSIRIMQLRAVEEHGYIPGIKGELKPDEKVVQQNQKKIKKKLEKPISTFIVTWAQNATPVNQPFLDSLLQCCKHRNAHLIVIAGRYKNPTSIWTVNNQEDEYWAAEVAPYLIDTRIELHPYMMVMGDIKIPPTKHNPESGFASISHNQSAIFGHPKIALESVATPQNKWPKLLTTTGAVTKENYTDSAAGKKGEFHHSYGASIVEIQGNHFHLRQINACEDGSFIDLDTEYTPTGHHKAGRAKGLVLGDLHWQFADPSCIEAIFGKGGMIDYFRPEKVAFHDWVDFYSGSHHHRKNFLIELAKRRGGYNCVRNEIVGMFEETSKLMRDDVDYYVVDSNHNRHLTQWLHGTDPRSDLDNFSFWVEVASLIDPLVLMHPTGAQIPNPLQLLAEKYLPNQDNLHFLTRSDRLMIADIDCTNHGDQGVNGARGSVNAFADIGVKSITGHGHSPAIRRGHYRVGTNSLMQREYTGDLSSWLQTDCVIYANGKRSLIHKFDGNWRAKKKRSR